MLLSLKRLVAAPLPRRAWLRRLLFFSVFCFLLSTFCFVFRAPLLTGLAKAWIINDRPQKADAVVVLGGGEQSRPFEAARLYREGFVSKVLVSKVKLERPTDRLGLTTISGTELSKKVLLHEGVPESALVFIGNDVQSTYEEALAVREWVKQTGAKSVLIPTDLFHTRRAAWIFRKTLASSGVTWRVIALAPEEYTASDWWQHEEGLIAFNNELVKHVRYRLKY